MATKKKSRKKASKRKVAKKRKVTAKKKAAATTPTPKRKVTKRRKRSVSKKRRVDLTKNKVAIHARVKALVAQAKTREKEPHSEKALKKFSLSQFRIALAKGCRKCKGTGLVLDKNCKCLIKKDHSDCSNYCACINEISDGNFINHCDQYYAWYYACVDYGLPKA